MDQRIITTEVRSYSSGTKGRCITSARSNHFVVDDADYSGGPNEAITAAEAFLSGLTACAVLMLERLAREGDIPLKWADVSVEASRDREVDHDKTYSVFDGVHMRFELTGPSEAQCRNLVETYKRR